MYNLGIDIGFSSVKVSLLEGTHLLYHEYLLHKGKSNAALSALLKRLSLRFSPRDILFGAATGSGAKTLVAKGRINHCNEVSALVEGVSILHKGCRSIIEIGGEGSKYITGCYEENPANLQVSLNSNCAAGTGAFLEEQISRLNLRLEEYATYASRAKSIPRIAGRCSVFAKTDITHHQQEGVPVEDILLGLAHALVKNYRSAVIRQLPILKPIFFAGGVAFNTGILAPLREVLQLGEEELFVSPESGNAGAIGAAAIAGREKLRFDPEALMTALLNPIETEPKIRKLPTLQGHGADDGKDKHICAIPATGPIPVECSLGVDVGSTSTNIVLVNEKNDIISYNYLRTLGNPVGALRKGFLEMSALLGKTVRINSVGVTGSGRTLIGNLIGADVVKDEITAQAKAASFLDETVNTVFEIGGQDSKYISLKQGVVVDFQMNKICAAGTGSFIEEQSKKFDIPIETFGELALESEAPLDLGERCTVFIETSIASHLAQGATLKDIASGLCYSIVKNYLNRVVGRKKIGDRIFLQGGIAYNQGIVNAFRVLTGKDICVPPFFSVTGAYGAAMLAREAKEAGPSRFKGFDVFERQDADIAMSPAENTCDGKIAATNRFNRDIAALIFEGYDGRMDPEKKTVGIPRALFTYGMYPLFSTFFRELGFNVLLSDPTNETTIRLGQEYAQDELCYPIKLVTGHVAELVNRKVEYIFFPDLHTVTHPGSQTRQNYGCAYMQLAFKLINATMKLSEKCITLLSPTIAFNMGERFMRQSFGALGSHLGKTEEETGRALQKGMQAVLAFEKRLQRRGEEELAKIGPSEKVFVVISKIYGIADPVLNMGIPDTLANKGYKVLTFFDLPENDCSKEHPNMYWPFGQHILEPAAIIRDRPGTYAILLTHHCCGPDSVLAHYFREIMGDKPYLNIEVDEHSSPVGVTTRIEAFLNSLEGAERKRAQRDGNEDDIRSSRDETVNILHDFRTLGKEHAVAVPFLFPYSSILAALLRREGVNAEELPEPDQRALGRGRACTLTNEPLSLTGLLGAVFRKLEEDTTKRQIAFCIPQNEGAEVDGQFSRLLRTCLDEGGYHHVPLVAPFLEDLPDMAPEKAERLFHAILAGDVVLSAPRSLRRDVLDRVLALLDEDCLDISALTRVATDISERWRERGPAKQLLALGEPFILYGDFLNDGILKRLETDHGHRVAYAPLSECLWLFWFDTLNVIPEKTRATRRELLQRFESAMRRVSAALSAVSPFAENLEDLARLADKTVGLYSGAFGRYRNAKALQVPVGVQGVLAVSSTYENTAILLNSLHEGFAKTMPSKPFLDLTFDGNVNENDRTKVESFVHYL